METSSDSGGTLDDVDAAASAARRAVTPPWLAVLIAVLIAVMWSAIYGGGQQLRDIVIAVIIGVPVILVLVRLAAWRGIKPDPDAAGPLGLIVIGVESAIVVFVSSALAEHFSVGTAAAYLAVFVAAFVIYGAGFMVIAWGTRRRGR